MRTILLTLAISLVCFTAEGAINPVTNDLPAFSAGNSKEGEIALLDNLIEVTQVNLEAQKALRVQVQNYLAIQGEYLKKPNDKDQTLKMVKEAHYLLGNIKEAHLTHAFSPEFISELTFFSDIAVKRGIPKP